MVHSKVTQRYVEVYWDSDMNRIFAEGVWNCFKTEGVDWRFILSVEEQRAFVQDVAGCRKEIDVEAADADDDLGI